MDKLITIHKAFDRYLPSWAWGRFHVPAFLSATTPPDASRPVTSIITLLGNLIVN